MITFLNYFQKTNNLIGVDPTAQKFKNFIKRIFIFVVIFPKK